VQGRLIALCVLEKTMGRAGKRIAGTPFNSGFTFMYEIIVFSTIGFFNINIMPWYIYRLG